MPIYKGLSQNNPTDITVGGVPMQRVYVGDRLVWQKDVAPAFTAVKYGLLYNWYAATDVRNICAEGWEVPEKTDWDTLIAYCGGSSVAGGKLKEVGSMGATNEFGFNGKLSGHRSTPGVFYLINNAGYFWSLSIHSSTYPAFYSLTLNSTILGYGGNNKTVGYSIRIIKTSTSLTHGQTGTYTGNDGKVYRTICIGTQEWLADNLAETLFRDLTPIPEVTDNAAWAALTTGALCAYNNDWSNVLM